MRDAVGKAIGERLNESTLDKVVRNTASSWSQSGHLEGANLQDSAHSEADAAAVRFRSLPRRCGGVPRRGHALERAG